MEEGFTVSSKNDSKEKEEIAGGFVGNADLARMSHNTVNNLKQVSSEQTAGGFAGETSFAYLASIDADSSLVEALLQVISVVVKAIYNESLAELVGSGIDIGLGKILTVKVLGDPEVVEVNLLGLIVRISVNRLDGEQYDVVSVEIGDSKIQLKCDKDGQLIEDGQDELVINLIKANRTKIDSCTVTGVSGSAIGYDVYGSGATNNSNGINDGYAGGFVGYNNEGLLKNNNMYYCDVVRGVAGKTGPFTGSSSLESNWNFNTIASIEGDNNQYRIYRQTEDNTEYRHLLKADNSEICTKHSKEPTWNNIYRIVHMQTNTVQRFTDLKGALMSDGTQTKIPVEAYQENGAKAVLMNDVKTYPTESGDEEEPDDIQDPCKDKVELRIKKVWKNDTEKERPDVITLTITRTYQNDNGEKVGDNEFEEVIEMSKEDYQSKNVWEKIVSGLDAYRIGEGNGKKYYYTYYVSEELSENSDYETTISYPREDDTNKYHYTMVITNTKKTIWQEILPDTGGIGTTAIYMLGILLFGTYLGMTSYKRRKCSKQ